MAEPVKLRPKPRLRVISGAKARSFEASMSDRLVGSWTQTPIPINTLLFQYLRGQRAKAREQSINNSYVKRYLHLMRTNVVGSTGIQFQARSRDGKTLDTKANDAIEAEFARFCKREHIDFNKKLSLKGICNQCVGSLATDGEFFLHKRYGATAGEYSFSLQVIDPERVDLTHNETLKSGNTVVMGVELNASNTIVAYHFAEQVHQIYAAVQTTTNRIRIPVDDIIHVFIQEYVGQLRGIPTLSTPLMDLKMLHAYKESALVAARIGAAKGGFYTNTTEATDFVGQQTDDGAFVDEVEPGRHQILPKGWKFDAYDPDYPHEQYGNFTTTSLRAIASGLNVSYSMLANDLTDVNYSSIRAGVLEDREHYKCWQDLLIVDLCGPIYDVFLQFALLASKIKVNDRPLPFSKVDKFSQCTWLGRRWEWVDPLKDYKAKKAQQEDFVMSRTEIIRDRGRDPEEVFAEIEQEQAMLKKLRVFNEEQPQVSSE